MVTRAPILPVGLCFMLVSSLVLMPGCSSRHNKEARADSAPTVTARSSHEIPENRTAQAGPFAGRGQYNGSDAAPAETAGDYAAAGYPAPTSEYGTQDAGQRVETGYGAYDAGNGTQQAGAAGGYDPYASAGGFQNQQQTAYDATGAPYAQDASYDTGAYDAQAGAYDAQAGAYGAQAGAYDAQAGAYDAQAGAYDAQAGAYDAQAGAYDAQYDNNSGAYDGSYASAATGQQGAYSDYGSSQQNAVAYPGYAAPAASPQGYAQPRAAAPRASQVRSAPAPRQIATASNFALGGETYTVAAGDTLSHIARSYGVNWKKLAAVNNISDPSKLLVGQKLVIP